ncbi:MAG: acyl-CoA dehydrogenase family protein [Myxococcota bacterium]
MEAAAKARSAFDGWRERAHTDWFADDPHLGAIARHHQLDVDGLRAFGRVSAQQIDPLVRENNRDENLPRLRRYDAVGHRIEQVDHHPTYGAIGRLAYRPGVMTAFGAPGGELAACASMYLFAQNGEAGHACPMACTAGLIKILRAAGNPRPDWLAGLTNADYDHHLRAAQFLTEVQGGSDVGANAVVATDTGDGWATLTGEKWFCSVIDADLFLVTARPAGAGPGTAPLQGYVVPRTLDTGEVNGFRIRRLKYKLGTRSMASAEVDFDGARGLLVGDFRRVMDEVISTSRLLNAVCCAAFLQRAAREASGYAAARTAFGQPITRFPTVARKLAGLVVEAYAARGLTFHLAALADRVGLGRASDRDKRAFRMLLNLNKIWTSERCTQGIRDAIEVLGGNGAIEEFSPLPRLLRDAVVLEAWEGGHNVLCSQILRDSQRLGLHEDLFGYLAELGAPPERLAEVRARWTTALASDHAAWHVRDLVDELRPAAQAAALTAEGSADPRAALVAEHLLATTTRATTTGGWDPLTDPDLPARVTRLVEP